MFGENRVQESEDKWPALLERVPDVQVHLVGPLQSNKVKRAVRLFHGIQTWIAQSLPVLWPMSSTRRAASQSALSKLIPGRSHRKRVYCP